MSRKNRKLSIRKQSKKIVDSRRVRFGGGWMPASLSRTPDLATQDAGKVRFGGGWMPASLRK